MEIKISASAIQYLKEALCNIYWYKNDLKGFLLNCISDKTIIYKVDWSNYKRQIVSDIIDELMKNQERNLGDIRRILYEVTQMTSFRHLEQIEDGKRKAERAKASVYDLKRIIEDHDAQLKKEAVIRKKRIENMEKIKSSQALLTRLDDIKQIYSKLVISKDHHRRGFELEKVLYNIFELFDLDPRASFRNIGEQIDGAFSLEGTDYLFEAKWQSYAVNASDLDAFSGKISRKLDNTLGLFLSINGFSEDAVKIYSSGRSTILLMDGMDLLAVLENRIDIVSLIVRKRRHAAQTGNIYFKVEKLLND
ncbi:restriction endonuclease [Bacillus cereus]|uniref:restriction endonuclease n=1 Tax=Bacillus cereus TaxID=1396 RepID=UPI003D04802A